MVTRYANTMPRFQCDAYAPLKAELNRAVFAVRRYAEQVQNEDNASNAAQDARKKVTDKLRTLVEVRTRIERELLRLFPNG